jgi:hypothetical protein
MSDLVELVINDLTKTMRTTLTPFIEKIESTNKQYQTLIDIMSNMPEFKQLVDENIQLKKELCSSRVNNEKVEDVIEYVQDNVVPNTISITLEVTQLNNAIDSNLNMTEHVKDIYNSVTTKEYTINDIETEDEEVEEEEVEDEDEDEEEEVEEEEEEVDEVEDEDEVEEEEEDVKVEEEVEEEEVEDEVEDEVEEEVEDEVEEEVEDEVEEEVDVKVEEVVKVEEEVLVEEEDEEVFIVEIDDVEYYTSDEVNGIIYRITSNEEVGDKVGQFNNGEPTFL